jgi:hypothetical protein
MNAFAGTLGREKTGYHGIHVERLEVVVLLTSAQEYNRGRGFMGER